MKKTVCLLLACSSLIAFAQNTDRITWTHLSSQDGKIPMPNVGRQAASLVFDVDNDGTDEFLIAGWSYPSMVWFKKTEKGWDKYLMDDRDSQIEAGGTCWDIDGDGDLDVLQGERYLGNHLWWWENPDPDFDPRKPWERHIIKDWGGNQYHDQIIGDIDGDGKGELIAWNQRARVLWVADIPDRPNKAKNWEFHQIWTWPQEFKYEGLAISDIDLDGKDDLIGGGYWFKHMDGKNFQVNMIDDYGQSRSATGDLIEGGNPEVVLGSGDGINSLNLYELVEGSWRKTVLLEELDHGHTLDVKDIDGDGHLDIYAAEMYRPGAGPACRQFILFGDGMGNFEMQMISVGIGTHEGRLGDLDGDGDIDILQKDFQEQRRVDVWINEGTNPDEANKNLDKWTYIQADNMRTRFGGRKGGDGYWFGLAIGDLNGDGYKDIASGKWYYINPGGSMESKWVRTELGDSLDALLIMDVDGDEYGDIIAARCNRQYWIEITDPGKQEFTIRQIGTLPVCNHGTSTQGYNLAQVIPGGKEEILLNADGVFCLVVPENPEKDKWQQLTILEEGSNGEWVSAGDMDNDGDIDVCAFLSNTKEQDRNINRVTWLENPGEATGGWEKHTIGLTNYHGDKVVPADINGDGRLDLVATEERWPGMEPDASMYWYEAPGDPGFWNWPRHRIVTQYSMNNLDVADLDQDGDQDIVTCEHKGPAEQLQVWENDGRGNFSLHVIDKGKESHAGARLSDLDGDGDLDIVSIAWNEFEFLHVWRNDAIMGEGTGRAKHIPLGFELTDDYEYYTPVTITAEKYDYNNKVLEVPLDPGEGIDPGSIRVVEVNDQGDIIDGAVVYQVERNNDGPLEGKLVFLVKGSLMKSAPRHFRILCGPAGGYYLTPLFPKIVQYDNYVQHQGQASFQLVTKTATYFYDREGGGFASMIDTEGNDWISYKPGGGSAGEYRGIPNIRPAGFHPGYEGLRSQVLHSGPLKTTFQSETNDEVWACKWEVYPGYATMTLLRKGEGNYWLLYEGTPAGQLDVEDDYWVRSDGTRQPVSESWTGVLPDPEWVWFGDKKFNRVLFLAKHEHDDKIDQFWQMQGNMTVFGFGRKPDETPGTYMNEVPVHLTIGFAESTDYEQVIKTIQGAVNNPLIKVGKIQKLSK